MNRAEQVDAYNKAKEMMIDGHTFAEIKSETGLREKDLRDLEQMK